MWNRKLVTFAAALGMSAVMLPVTAFAWTVQVEIEDEDGSKYVVEVPGDAVLDIVDGSARGNGVAQEEGPSRKILPEAKRDLSMRGNVSFTIPNGERTIQNLAFSAAGNDALLTNGRLMLLQKQAETGVASLYMDKAMTLSLDRNVPMERAAGSSIAYSMELDTGWVCVNPEMAELYLLLCYADGSVEERMVSVSLAENGDGTYKLVFSLETQKEIAEGYMALLVKGN